MAPLFGLARWEPPAGYLPRKFGERDAFPFPLFLRPGGALWLECHTYYLILRRILS